MIQWRVSKDVQAKLVVTVKLVNDSLNVDDSTQTRPSVKHLIHTQA